jgi:hypothetical protein
MRKLARFLLIASRFLAIVAILAGVGAGLYEATIGRFIACFDNCPVPGDYFANQGPAAVQQMTPCVVIEALAVVIFLAYCAATRQPRRAVISLLALLIGGLVGGVALYAFLEHGQASVSLTHDQYYAYFVERSLETWVTLWGLGLMVVAGVWSGVLARLQWSAE